ncbi:threonine--tRNA ligase [candidate division CSSED10-310 bacterium]|uniref:Threonine--tRNA ligase n=1 Tax=candidate division CSSED10-310 bacterium TaxID=2855610 RepID=A0ABV6Z511_UNCC1
MSSPVKIDVPAHEIVADFLKKNAAKIQQQQFVALKVNDRILDLKTVFEETKQVELIPLQSKEGLHILRHSSAHLMAQAVTQLFPGTMLTIGPTIENGFYYDFDSNHTFSPADFEAIEQRMTELARADIQVKRREVSRLKAIEYYKTEQQDPYKLELLEEFTDETVSFYDQGDFTDLCRGPHLPATSFIRFFKLLNVAGAYWRGDERNKMLQRIYGTAFSDKKALRQYLHNLEEAKKRDHRKLGRDLELFSIEQEFGSGLPLWHPKGALVRTIMEDFWKREHLKNGYQMVMTPHIAKVDLWKKSGHWDFYRENMYSPIKVEAQDFVIKPMNCPGHVKIYQSKLRSYREFPLRWAELGTVYRFERSGVLHGLTRVRGFTQDDAHVFCRPDQLHDEIIKVIDFVLFILRTFGFSEYDVYLSTKPEKSVGSDEHWELATEALREALEYTKLDYEIDPGEGVFYGPKIDLKIKDALQRAWQCSTIQVDFNLPQRFDMTYIGEDGKEHRPIMIHRALMGSVERFFAILIEHYNGALPSWLAPVQVIILSIADRHLPYARELQAHLKSNDIRVEIDERNEKINYKIREAQVQKIPYMIILGDQEVQDKNIALRHRKQGDLGKMSLDNFLNKLLTEIKEKSIM